MTSCSHCHPEPVERSILYMPFLSGHQRLPHILHAATRAFGSYKGEITALIGLGFLSGILEGIGVNAVIPLFSFITGGEDIPGDFISSSIRTFFQLLHLEYKLPYLLILIALLFIGKAIALFWSRYLTERIRERYILETREHLFDLTLKANWTYLLKQKIGYLEKVLINDINAAAGLLTHISGGVILATNTLVYVVIAINISVMITLLTLIVGGIVFLVFKPLVYKAKTISHRNTEIMKEIAHHINESMIGIKTIKAASKETSIVQRAKKYFEQMRQINLKISILDNITYVAIQPISLILVLVLFTFSYLTANFHLPSFIVVVYAINKIFTYVQAGQSKLNNISTLYPFLQSALQYEEVAVNNTERDTGSAPFRLERSIILEKVSFAYGRKGASLEDLNITIPKGTSLAIVGPSGAGKTTLVDLLLRLIEPHSGRITVDGRNVRDISVSEWRRHIGYMAQDMFFTNDTVKHNIRFYDPTITDHDVVAAAKQAACHDFILALPHGYDTIMGERGIELSGGQRQRIALARVLAHKPDILILDEPTSALDPESESHIWNAIDVLRGHVTIVFITHDARSVIHANHAVIIEKGAVVEQGLPAALIERSGSYLSKLMNS